MQLFLDARTDKYLNWNLAIGVFRSSRLLSWRSWAVSGGTRSGLEKSAAANDATAGVCSLTADRACAGDRETGFATFASNTLESLQFELFPSHGVGYCRDGRVRWVQVLWSGTWRERQASHRRWWGFRRRFKRYGRRSRSSKTLTSSSSSLDFPAWGRRWWLDSFITFRVVRPSALLSRKTRPRFPRIPSIAKSLVTKRAPSRGPSAREWDASSRPMEERSSSTSSTIFRLSSSQIGRA